MRSICGYLLNTADCVLYPGVFLSLVRGGGQARSGNLEFEGTSNLIAENEVWGSFVLETNPNPRFLRSKCPPALYTPNLLNLPRIFGGTARPGSDLPVGRSLRIIDPKYRHAPSAQRSRVGELATSDRNTPLGGRPCISMSGRDIRRECVLDAHLRLAPFITWRGAAQASAHRGARVCTYSNQAPRTFALVRCW